MKASKFLFLFLCLGLCNVSIAQTKVYLGYDANCMDRYEYHYNSNPTGNAHIAYHIIMNDREKVILEVGIESRINQARPKSVKTCSNFSINERMVRRINNGEVQLFIVKKNGNGYNVSEVGLAAYSQISPASISFSSMDSRFSYNYNKPADGTNLASNGSDGSVYFEGVVSHDCPKQYQFNKKTKGGGRNFTEWIVLPEIGIIQEKKGFNQIDAENNILKLTHINGMSINQYLNDFCRSVDLDFYSGKFYDGKASKGSAVSDDNDVFVLEEETKATNNGRTGNNDRVTTTWTQPDRGACDVYKDVDRGIYIDWSTGQAANKDCGGRSYRNGYILGENQGTVVTNTPPTRYTPPTVVTQPQAAPQPAPRTRFCSEESQYGYHIVQRDETLFGIARTYGLTVKQLSSWNNLKSNRIYPCSKLVTIAPNTASNSGVVFSEKGDQGNFRVSSPEGYHIVQRNETLYQLSKRYGMTVDKFRALNGLGSNDQIFIGQQLKVLECNCPNPELSSKGGHSDVAFAPTRTRDTRVVAFDNVDRRIDTPKEFNMVGTERLVARGNEEAVEYAQGKKRRFYIVKEDDTIFKISKKYGITVEQLRSINDLETNEVIIPYQRIYLDY